MSNEIILQVEYGGKLHRAVQMAEWLLVSFSLKNGIFYSNRGINRLTRDACKILDVMG